MWTSVTVTEIVQDARPVRRLADHPALAVHPPHAELAEEALRGTRTRSPRAETPPAASPATQDRDTPLDHAYHCEQKARARHRRTVTTIRLDDSPATLKSGTVEVHAAGPTPE